MRKTALIPFLLLAVWEAADARVVKWVDASGHIHYSENAPAGQNTQEIEAPPPPTAPTGSGTDTIMREMESAERARKANRETQESALAQQLANERKAKCAQAQRNLAILQRQARLYTTDANGDRQYMDDEARAAEVARMEAQVAANCESP